MVFSKGPSAVGGPGGAAFAPEQFEICINSPVRLLACWISRQEHTSLCLSVLTGEPQCGGNLLLGVLCSSQFCRQLSPRSARPFRQLVMVLL